MNHDMVNRIRDAKRYQKKALLALFPESTAEHIEVIGKELTAIVMECAVDIIKQNGESGNTQENQDKECKKEEKESRVKKVTID
jgi:hypothetical protein